MRNTNKKGFTIVELVIVVAVIAILAAVLIPTFSGIIDRANLSADQQAVRNMNIALAAETNKPSNIIDAAAILAKAGFNTEKGLSPAYKGHAYYWFKPTNQVVYVDETDGKFDLIFPEKVEGFPVAKNNDCQPLSVAIEGVVKAPVVSETTVIVDTNVNPLIPNDITSFDAMIDYVTSGEDKDLYCMIDNAKKSGILISAGTIKLTEDIVIDVINTYSNGNTLAFNITDEVTIDLNGHTITQKGSGLSLALFVVRNGGTLNIIDSSADQSGAILASLSAFQIDAGGTVNLYSGKVGVSPDEYRSAADVGMTEDGTVNNASGGAALVWTYGGVFNMYGGTVDATCNSHGDYEWAIIDNGNATAGSNLYSGNIVGWIQDGYGNVNYFGTICTEPSYK